MLIDILIDVGMTVLVLAALLFTSVVLLSARPPRGPRL
jgi:hypothetical protein